MTNSNNNNNNTNDSPTSLSSSTTLSLSSSSLTSSFDFVSSNKSSLTTTSSTPILIRKIVSVTAIIVMIVLVLTKNWIQGSILNKTNSSSSSLSFIDDLSLSGFFGPNKYVFVLGLPRSGSDSIHAFYTCNHVSSSHYCCNDSYDQKHHPPTQKNQRKLQEQQQQEQQQPRSRKVNTNTKFPCSDSSITCGECVYNNIVNGNAPFDRCSTKGYGLQVYSQFDVETTNPLSWFLPQHFALPLLYEAYDPKNTIWILNYRSSPEVWADNVLHWYSVTKRILKAFDINYYSDVIDSTVKYAPKHNISLDTLYKALEKSYDRSHDPKEHERRRNELIRIYQIHMEKVRSYATLYNQPLIELNVDDPNAGWILSTTFTDASKTFLHQKKTCWSFNATQLDNDWKDFTLP